MSWKGPLKMNSMWLPEQLSSEVKNVKCFNSLAIKSSFKISVASFLMQFHNLGRENMCNQFLAQRM